MKPRRRARARGHAPRDQSASRFADILADLVDRVPGAHAAALVDFEGETVDYAGAMSPFDVRVAAAHMRLLLDSGRPAEGTGAATWLAFRAAKRTYVAYELADGYALVLVMARRAAHVGWERAVSAAAGALAREAGWAHSTKRSWRAVDVRCDERDRPVDVVDGGRSHPVEILGSVMGLRRRERGWRVRLPTGIEATLIREVGSRWYADERLDGLNSRASEESR